MDFKWTQCHCCNHQKWHYIQWFSHSILHFIAQSHSKSVTLSFKLDTDWRTQSCGGDHNLCFAVRNGDNFTIQFNSQTELMSLQSQKLLATFTDFNFLKSRKLILKDLWQHINQWLPVSLNLKIYSEPLMNSSLTFMFWVAQNIHAEKYNITV